MDQTKRRILFFTPFATRTGSEMMLLYILRHIDRSRFDVGIVSFANGELLKEFPADIPVFIVPAKFSIPQKVMFHLGVNPILKALRKIGKDFKADLWYVNTTMLPYTAVVAKELSVKLITHFHELPLTYIYLSYNDFGSIIKNSDRLIGCSKVTCEAIEQAGGKNVSLLYEFIDSQKISTNPQRTAELRNTLNIPKDHYIWIMSGMTSERKGFDFLPAIAEELDDDRIHLIWVGEKIDDGLFYYTEQRCLNNKSRTHIHIVGKQKEDYYNYLDMGNGFLLTSRQDPFPLVMIEAAHLGKPIVGFPSGGVAEFIEEGMGAVTDDISVKQMAGAMRKIMSGEIPTDAAKSKAVASRYSVENGYREWVKIIEKDC